MESKLDTRRQDLCLVSRTAPLHVPQRDEFVRIYFIRPVMPELSYNAGQLLISAIVAGHINALL
jgi:hypothetical protein